MSIPEKRKLQLHTAFILSLSMSAAFILPAFVLPEKLDTLSRNEFNLYKENVKNNTDLLEKKIDFLEKEIDWYFKFLISIGAIIAGIAAYIGFSDWLSIKRYKMAKEKELEDFKKKKEEEIHDFTIKKQNELADFNEKRSKELNEYILSRRKEIDDKLIVMETDYNTGLNKLSQRFEEALILKQIHFEQSVPSKNSKQYSVVTRRDRIEYESNGIDIIYTIDERIKSLTPLGIDRITYILAFGDKAVVSEAMNYNKSESEVLRQGNSFFVKLLKSLKPDDPPFDSVLTCRISNEFGDAINSWLILRNEPITDMHTLEICFHKKRKCKQIEIFEIIDSKEKLFVLKPTIKESDQLDIFIYEFPVPSNYIPRFKIQWELEPLDEVVRIK